MAATKYTWYKIAESEKELQFNSNGLLITGVNNKKITVAKKNNRLYACGYACPHAGGILAEGYVDALGNIVCPVHHYRFNMQNGRNTSGEGYFLKTYLVEVREDGVYVGIEEKKLFGFL
jgi:nitrite reductase/ring-hydroxylating ferredoxin subunit